jgi:MFS family permease
MSRSTARTSTPGIWSPQFLWTTIGSNALIFLGAFETLAVTTIMPIISRDLDGEALYSVAFSGTLAASVIGMVVAGGWADRRGPTRPLLTAIVVFLVGLLLSGTATSMGLFIVGRFMQGLGSGAIGVAIYVVVARLYPAGLHPKIFGAFAAAWVLPSMIGPPAAGVVAELFTWHWVFLGVAVLMLLASTLLIPALRLLRSTSTRAADDAASHTTNPGHINVLWAIAVAAGILGISLGGDSGGPLAIPIVIAAAIVVVVSLRPLLPKGTLLAKRGLPATVLLRGGVAAGFYASEIYLPYLLNDRYGLPSWLAGLILTVAAISWAIGSAIQGRLGDRMSHDLALRLGAGLLVIGVGTVALTAGFLSSPFVAAAAWMVCGFGMGLMFPRMSTLALAYSTERNQGFNSAAMSIADATGGATAIAFTGLLFVGFGAAEGQFSFVAALVLTTAIAIVSVPVAFRSRTLS